MTPRLAVTQKQAEVVESVLIGPNGDQAVLRLPERPTMPCPECGGYATDRWRCDGVEVDVVCNYCNGSGSVPIPEGTRVEVGWWEPNEPDATDDIVYHWSWHPVAFATLAEVHDESCLMPHSPDCCGYCPGEFVITLSDINPVEADQ